MGQQNSIFHQVLQWIPRHEFQKAVSQHEGDKKVRKFSCWMQFVTLLFGQLTGHNTVRSMVTALCTQERHLYHLGLDKVRRSTFCDANETRDSKILESVFYRLLNRTQVVAPGNGFRFKGKVVAMDSTTINLALSLCPWARFHHDKGACKLHTAIDLAGDLPGFMVMTPGDVHDVTVGRKRRFAPETTVVFDKGYVDFGWFQELDEAGVFFVTRMKKNCRFRVRECMEKTESQGICADQKVRLSSAAGQQYTHLLRRVSYHDEGTGKRYVFITNRFDLSAKTICDLYKARWEVELFFKTLKGQLRIEKFVGTSENAVLWQLWAAMIAYLLVSLIRFLNKLAWSLPSIMAVLTVSLFQKLDLSILFSDSPRERCYKLGLDKQLLLPI